MNTNVDVISRWRPWQVLLKILHVWEQKVLLTSKVFIWLSTFITNMNYDYFVRAIICSWVNLASRGSSILEWVIGSIRSTYFFSFICLLLRSHYLTAGRVFLRGIVPTFTYDSTGLLTSSWILLSCSCYMTTETRWFWRIIRIGRSVSWISNWIRVLSEDASTSRTCFKFKLNTYLGSRKSEPV